MRTCSAAIIAGSIVLVLACASGDQSITGYSDTVNRWEGQDANVLVRTWGPPATTFTMPNGNVVYVYAKSTELTTDKRLVCSYNTEQRADVCSITGGDTFRFGCKTTFEVGPTQLVVNGTAEGTLCTIAPEPPAGSAAPVTVPPTPAVAEPVAAPAAPQTTPPPPVDPAATPTGAANAEIAPPVGDSPTATEGTEKKKLKLFQRKHPKQ